jgi:hypothetical protein
MVDRTPCMISRAFEERGRSCYIDQPKTFDLVFADQIKIARGEARRFVGGGLVVHDKAEGKDRVIKADGVVFATGFATVDLPKKYAESGFIDAKSASMLENVSLFGSDDEGELPGYVTFSGRRCPLYLLFPMVACLPPFTRSSPLLFWNQLHHESLGCEFIASYPTPLIY